MSKSLKAIIVLAIAALTIGAGYWLYINFINPPTTPQPVTKTEQVGAVGGGLALVSVHSLAGYWVNGIETYTISDTGEVYKTVGNKEEQVTNQTLADIRSVNASADGGGAIVSFGSPTQETFTIFDVKTKSWQPLPANIIAADWDPQSADRIMYLGNDGSLRLYTLNPRTQRAELSSYDGNNKKSSELMRINIQDVQLEWPSANNAYLTEKPSNQPSSSWQIDIAKKTIQTFVKDEVGLSLAWAPDGSWVVKSSDQDNAVINNKGQVVTRLNIDPTLPAKCAVGSKNIFCAVPKQTARLEDYLKRKTYSDDALINFSLLLGVSDKINRSLTYKFIPGIGPWDVTNLKIANGKLFFVNRLNNKLYSLDL